MILFFVILFLFLIQFVLVLAFTLRAQSVKTEEGLCIDCVSIIIPFHNEQDRILTLLNSLNAETIPGQCEILFVDDHSTDHTAQIIKTVLTIPHRIIRSDSAPGKKNAIHLGVQYAQHDFILTLDSDVGLPSNFTEILFTCPAIDLIILPVEMTGNTFFQLLSATEFQWLQLLTFGSRTPVLCNGANLLFRKSSYLSSYNSRTDFDLASGDDVFLLRIFLKESRKITRINSEFLKVKTKAPSTFSELRKQRKRWVGKFKRMADQKNMRMLLFLILIQVGFIASLVLSFYNILFLIPVALKFISELIIVYRENSAQHPAFFIANLAHHFWYPIYLIALLFPTSQDFRWNRKQLN